MQSLTTQLLILTLSFLLFTVKLTRTDSRGDPCVDTSKLNGFCKYIFECPFVMQLKLNERRYKRCGFEDGKEVVCCGERPRRPNPLPINNSKRYVRECEKYKSEMFDKDVHLSANARPTTITTSKCNQYTHPLIVEGENADPKEFPHMALIGCPDDEGKTKWICGGTLISPNFILTAAHCIAAFVCDEITDVRVGELNIKSDTDDAEPRDYKVERAIMHPTYDEDLKYNDIALIKLRTNVEINEYRRPACLPYQNTTDTSQLIITGWGRIENSGKYADHLQKATIHLFDQVICDAIYPKDDDSELPSGIRERIQMCAGTNDTKKDTCQGDSGGPIQIVHPNHPCMYAVVGITSSGQACGNKKVPGLYTRVFHYIDWIEAIVWS